MASREEIAGIFNGILQRFDAAKAEGLNAVVQFDLSGDNGGAYWMKIADGKMEVGSGASENPKMTVRASADDFASMISGAINPMQAFMMGKIKIQGDTGLALKLMPLLS
ncbi:MAG: SCP2 sterol-binding domain-containing protein [Anaerolineae bacterium]|nr:SCP2 sterol-binding domain-containing protein [Anaerolineae bacterium]NUQ02476.1 SCP2 sterol-binding domain-containing protein [Anaerolineae bacterium]